MEGGCEGQAAVKTRSLAWVTTEYASSMVVKEKFLELSEVGGGIQCISSSIGDFFECGQCFASTGRTTLLPIGVDFARNLELRL